MSGLLQDGYRFMRDDESALAAIGAAHPAITMVGDSLVGLALLAVAAGLGRELGGRRAAIACALLLFAGAAAVVQALVREDCVARIGLCSAAGRGTDTTWRQPVHDAGATIAFLVLLIAPLLLIRVFRALPGWRDLAGYTLATVIVGVVLLVVFLATSDSSVGGLTELLFLVPPLVWVVVVGRRLAQRATVGGGGPGTGSARPA